MRIGFTVTAIAAAFPAVLASYRVGSSCTYEGPEQKTIYGCCRIRPPPFHGQAGNAYCAC
ncbi:hypothetical protein G3M48_003800 [Beauveria asiatica]|uniref:Uncharacterized protein n=1 Tax=Beauveria asiatica TaxID=1069075 RepID=A0AAW0RUU7_9HYPO